MKQGFTLIELLAVMVILAIISLIAVPIVLNIIQNVRQSVELNRAETLKEIVDFYIAKRYMSNNKITEEQIFVIKDNVEYQIDSEGNRTQTNNFEHKGVLCDYCVVKINSDRQVYILYEGKSQDIKKNYTSKKLVKEKLTQPRDVVSLYNEIVLFKDIYISKNDISDTKYFKSEGENIYEILTTGEEKEIFKLYNSSGKSSVKFISDSEYTITITTEEDIFEFNNNGFIGESENVNSKYSKEILNIYDELLLSAERYLQNTTVTDEEYFEFSNGVINRVDEYGETTLDSNMVLNPNLSGSGELRINSSNQVSIVIYDGNNNIKCDYGSEKLYTEQLKYSRDAFTLIKNLSRLELLAENYKGNKSATTDWLVFYYLRQLKYKDSESSLIKKYNIVAGEDTNFVKEVSENASNLATYFTKKNTYTVNGDKIDLKHMAASIAGILYDTPSVYHIAYEELEYDCVVSWAGDLHTLMEKSILKSGVKEEYGSYLNATYNLLGKSKTVFNMEDMNADIDAWVLAYNMKENPNLSIGEIFDKYYSGESNRSYKNRYTSFINIMNTIATQFNSSKVNFEGVVSHFTSSAKEWLTIGTLEITPTNAERKEIADGFIKWIKEQAAKE